MDLKVKFSEFKDNNYFSRVDKDHPLDLFIGIDENGCQTLELREKFIPQKVIGTSSIEIKQYQKPEYNTIRFSLTNMDMRGLFYKFCEDIIEQSRKIEKNKGYEFIVNRFYQWKKMFVVPQQGVLNENEVMGLIGEIMFLKMLIHELGSTQALNSWSADELTHKDFSYDDGWYEIKSIGSYSNTIHISSLEQLFSHNIGQLIVYRFEKMSPNYLGVKLNSLILETAELFESQLLKDTFYAKLKKRGYVYNDTYDQFVYECLSMNRYLVNDEFPKLTKNDVPFEIVKANYELSFYELDKFKIN